jgi:hypothetical protein
MSAVEQQTAKYGLLIVGTNHREICKISKPLDDLASHGNKEIAKLSNGVPEQPTSALQVSDIWHNIKGHIGPNLAFLYEGHNQGRRATITKQKRSQIIARF